jgi:hypothetical protein
MVGFSTALSLAGNSLTRDFGKSTGGLASGFQLKRCAGHCHDPRRLGNGLQLFTLGLDRTE